MHSCASAFICGFICLLAAGCASAVQAGRSTALDGADLVKMTDDMAMQIIADPEVQDAMSRGPLRVVVQPVENRMTAEVLPRGPSEAFTARIRMLLARYAPGQFTWVMHRDAYDRLRSQELEDIDLGPSPDAVDPEYALTATFSNLIHVDPKRRATYYLCVFELTNLQDRSVLWTGSYEVRKIAVRGFLD